MSWEAWGDDDAGNYDHLLNAGWQTPEDMENLRELVRLLGAESVYEGGEKNAGISVRFLMRLNLLTEAVGLPIAPELVAEARAALGVQP